MLANQLALTAGLRDNQRAITEGLAGNRAAFTQGLNNLGRVINQLPQPEDEPVGTVGGEPPNYEESQQDQIRMLNLERNFTQDDFITLNYFNWERPNLFFDLNRERLNELRQEVSTEIQSITGIINGRNRTRSPTQNYLATTQEYERQKVTMYKYRGAIVDYLSSLDYRTGQGIGNTNKLIDRLKLLGGSIMAGNNGVVPEFKQITKYLNSIGLLPTKELNKMMKTVQLYLN